MTSGSKVDLDMITFACKRIDKEELIRCSFDLNKTEYKVLMFFLKSKKKTVSQIANAMKLDRTTVQKAVKALADKQLAKRLQRNLSRGGYTFLYEVNKKDEIKNKMKKIVHEWYKNVEKSIDKL